MSLPPVAALTLTQEFTNVTNINELKAFFPIGEKTHTLEKQWNKIFLVVSFIFTGLAAFAYTQARQYLAAALGILTLGCALKSRVEVRVRTPKYDELCKHFERVIPEIRETWRVASGLIAGTINQQQHSFINTANQQAFILRNTYQVNVFSDDPFDPIEKNPMRGQFQDFYPIAEKFTENNLEQLSDLHPAVFFRLAELYSESERLVYGSSPKGPAYVENKLLNDDRTVTSTPWPVLNV